MKTFTEDHASSGKLHNLNIVLKVMEDLDQAVTKPSAQSEKESAHRKLRQLRIILIFWLVLFLVSLIWFFL